MPRSRVRANRLAVPENSMSCFGEDFRLEGQRRDSNLTDSKTGLMGIYVFLDHIRRLALSLWGMSSLKYVVENDTSR